MSVLVTGGAGYIGSHTCVELLERGYDVVVFDNFRSGHVEALNRVEEITGKKLRIVEGDIQDKIAVVRALQTHRCTSVIHFAGLKAVGESVKHPMMFYKNNVFGTITLLDAMTECDVKSIIFSSSATVYGDPQWLPITENHPLSVKTPYGRTKLMVENILRDLHKADPEWSIGILRYFNPVGAHPSGRIGEDPRREPTNLMPYIAQVAVGVRPFLRIWGDDYPTLDGTGERDYIHVVDLARGHIAAMDALTDPKLFEVNLGTGQSHSVLQMVEGIKSASGRDVPVKKMARREGDTATCYANVDLARTFLGWHAEFSVEDMCRDQWNWRSKNPNGYDS